MNKMQRPTVEEFARHKAHEKHKKNNPLRDVILGGQDGLVNSLGIILGATAAGSTENVLVATVLAALFAEGLSMGAVAYTSAISQRDYYLSERKIEEWEIEHEPEMEREEVLQIYEKKGFRGKVLDEIVDTITADKKLWVDTMMAEELEISPVNTHDALRSSVIVTIATMIGSFIPLTPFFLVNEQQVWIAVGVSTISLFAVGAYQAISLVGSWWRSGLRMVVIGLAAAFIGYFIASFFNAAYQH